MISILRYQHLGDQRFGRDPAFDYGFLPEGAKGEGYFESRDRSIYPLKTLMRAAAARRDPRNLSASGHCCKARS